MTPTGAIGRTYTSLVYNTKICTSFTSAAAGKGAGAGTSGVSASAGGSHAASGGPPPGARLLSRETVEAGGSAGGRIGRASLGDGAGARSRPTLFSRSVHSWRYLPQGIHRAVLCQRSVRALPATKAGGRRLDSLQILAGSARRQRRRQQQARSLLQDHALVPVPAAAHRLHLTR